MKFAGFDWDEGNRAKCQKHGVSIAEIEAAFFGEVRVAPDPAHSTDEERFIAIASGSEGKPMFVAFTMRGEGQRLVRPISARYMHAKEVQRYEEHARRSEDEQ